MPNFGNKDLSEFFNVQSSKQEIADTYIPRDNRKVIEKNSSAFDKFDSKKKR